MHLPPISTLKRPFRERSSSTTIREQCLTSSPSWTAGRHLVDSHDVHARISTCTSDDDVEDDDDDECRGTVDTIELLPRRLLSAQLVGFDFRPPLNEISSTAGSSERRQVEYSTHGPASGSSLNHGTPRDVIVVDDVSSTDCRSLPSAADDSASDSLRMPSKRQGCSVGSSRISVDMTADLILSSSNTDDDDGSDNDNDLIKPWINHSAVVDIVSSINQPSFFPSVTLDPPEDHPLTSSSTTSLNSNTLMPPGSYTGLSSSSVTSQSPIPFVSSAGPNSRRKRALSISPLSSSEGFDLNAIIRTSPTSLLMAPSPSSSSGNYGHVSIRKSSSTDETNLEQCSMSGGGGGGGTGDGLSKAFDNHLVMHRNILQQWEQQMFSSDLIRGSNVDSPEDASNASKTVRDMLFLDVDSVPPMDFGFHPMTQDTLLDIDSHRLDFVEERFRQEDGTMGCLTEEFACSLPDWLKFETASRHDDDDDDSSSLSSSSADSPVTTTTTKTTTPAVDDEQHRCRWIDCSLVCRDRDDLVRHIERAHVDQRKGSEDFTCFWQGCPRRLRAFNARYKLLIHMRVHSGEKPNKCTFQGCGKAFSRLENLKIHQRSHTGERPYACQHSGCSKAFSNSSDRAKHQRTHVNTKPYACQMQGCSKRYTDPSSLRKHVKNHFVKEQKIRTKVRGYQTEVISDSPSDNYSGFIDPNSSCRSSSSTQSDSNRESPTSALRQRWPSDGIDMTAADDHQWAEFNPFDSFTISPKSEALDVESQFLRDAILFNNGYTDLCVDEFFDALDASANNMQMSLHRTSEPEDDLICKWPAVYADM